MCSMDDSRQGPRPDPIRVLLIEDNEGFSHFIRYQLQQQQHHGVFTLVTADSLAAGLAVIDAGGIDVILLDLGLPDSARFETFTAVYGRAPQIPVIILTVLDDDEIALKAVRAGAQDYLVKDQLDGSLLVRSVRYALERAGAEQQLRQLSSRLLQLQDEERRRLARSLHDTTAQNLAALGMNLSLLKTLLPAANKEAARVVDESAAFVDQCFVELRTMSYLLHPPLLDELGLGGALRDYADGFAERSGIRVDLELPHGMGRLPRPVEHAVFRVAQESLANIHRHSGSPTASIILTLQDDAVRIAIRDAGCGFDPAHAQPADGAIAGLGVGIAGMHERVRQLGGQIEIESGPTGTTVSAAVPLTGNEE